MTTYDAQPSAILERLNVLQRRIVGIRSAYSAFEDEGLAAVELPAFVNHAGRIIALRDVSRGHFEVTQEYLLLLHTARIDGAPRYYDPNKSAAASWLVPVLLYFNDRKTLSLDAGGSDGIVRLCVAQPGATHTKLARDKATYWGCVFRMHITTGHDRA